MFGFLKRPRQALRLSGAMVSHVGTVRRHNEDRGTFRIVAGGVDEASDMVLGVVADGMGGHAAGEVASEIIVETCLAWFRQGVVKAPAWIKETLLLADQNVRAAAKADASRAGMGATAALILIENGRLYTGHVGDARIYRFRNDELTQITRDHSLVAELVARGDLTEEASRTHPQRNVVLQAVGTGRGVSPEVSAKGERLLPGDRILVCSDGLNDALHDSEIAACLRGVGDTAAACNALCADALNAGASDNVSIGLFDARIHAAAPAGVNSPLAETGDIVLEGAFS